MREIVLAILLIGALIGVSIAQAAPATSLVAEGQFMMLAAAAVGIPLQAVYFAVLFIALTASGVRPAGWYWRPFEHHHLLTSGQRWVVLPVFFVGALSFLAILLGIAIVCLGLVDLYFES